jgi:hypothetical protein
VMDKALVLYERGLCFHRRKKLIAAEDDLTDAIDHIVAEIEVTLGINLIVTLEKQLLNMIGKLVYSG